MIEIRPTGPEDLPRLAGLFGERFGHPISSEEWQWKYRRLPGEARSWVAVAADGDVLAHAGALCLPARLESGPEPEREDPEGSAPRGIWQLTDWAGTTGRGGLRPPLVGLGRRLLADLPRSGDAPWIFGFPSERHFLLGRRVFGYAPLPSIMPLAGPIPRLPEASAQGSGTLLEISDHCDGPPESLAPAWDACGVLGVRRSISFLNWRYHARPGRYYRFYRLRPEPGDGWAGAGGVGPDPGQGLDEGLAVFAFVGREAWAAELWLPTGRIGAEAWKGALAAVTADLLEAGLERWLFWPPPGLVVPDRPRREAGPSLGSVLEGLGLRPTGRPQLMGCRGRGRSVSPDLRFYYALGDYDVV